MGRGLIVALGSLAIGASLVACSKPSSNAEDAGVASVGPLPPSHTAKPPAEPRRFVVRRAVDGQKLELVGVVSIDSGYVVTVVSKEPGETRIDKLVEELNQSKTLTVRAPCDPAAPYSLRCSRVVARIDDRFLDALGDTLRERDELQLTPD